MEVQIGEAEVLERQSLEFREGGAGRRSTARHRLQQLQKTVPIHVVITGSNDSALTR